MEQIAVAITELQTQVSNLNGTVANLETMGLQLGEIDLPGLATRVQELLSMREQLGSDLPGLVHTVRELHTAHQRNEAERQERADRGDRFTSEDRWKKPVNEQKEKMLALPELHGPESFAAFRNRMRLILDGRWDFAGQ